MITPIQITMARPASMGTAQAIQDRVPESATAHTKTPFSTE